MGALARPLDRSGGAAAACFQRGVYTPLGRAGALLLLGDFSGTSLIGTWKSRSPGVVVRERNGSGLEGGRGRAPAGHVKVAVKDPHRPGGVTAGRPQWP